MKRLFFAITLMISANGLLLAQEQSSPNSPAMAARKSMTPEQRAQMMTDNLAKKLNLSDDQKKSVYDINLAAAQKMNDAMNNRDREAMKAAQQYRDAALQKVLTPDQLQQYQKLEAERMQKRAENRQNRMGSNSEN